ncbi:hypothetical protein RJ639_036681 [Escallonia herrerae]|uniref:Uncharacterized protein n=1 Tax=Escallonia herrerae TaxID=1293975 RepID=A0AA89B8R5_9ASTE|nr:hypothetical protein RJ639_036681 [Escallonia herrerae]
MRNKKENRKSNPNFRLPFIFHNHQTAFPTAAGAAATAIAIIRRLRPHCAITVHHRCIRAFDIDDDIFTFVHRVDDNFEFKLGMMFNSEDEAFNTHNAYARNKGFGRHSKLPLNLRSVMFLTSLLAWPINNDQVPPTPATVKAQMPWPNQIPQYMYNFQSPVQQIPQYQGFPFPGMHPVPPYYSGNMGWRPHVDGSGHGPRQHKSSSRKKDKLSNGKLGPEPAEEDQQMRNPICKRHICMKHR